VRRSFIATLGLVVCASAWGVPKASSAAFSLTDATNAAMSAEAQGRGNSKKSKKKSTTPEYREVLLPAGTRLALELRSRLASDTSQVEDTVRARLRERVTIEGQAVLPAGTQVVGYVTDVERPGRVKGRARLALRFTVLRHDGDEYDLRSKEIERVADSTKANDAAKVGIGAGAGAAVGAVLGGGSGAAKGAAIGAAAGTGTVLATRGEDVRFDVGEMLETQLTAPLRVLVRTR
jgi:hypothetical protein